MDQSSVNSKSLCLDLGMMLWNKCTWPYLNYGYCMYIMRGFIIMAPRLFMFAVCLKDLAYIAQSNTLFPSFS